MEGFEHVEQWRKRVYDGKDNIGLVEVSRHNKHPFAGCGPNGWCLYIDIYTNHAMYPALEAERNTPLAEGEYRYMDTIIGHDFEMHGGVTFFERMEHGYKIGCDYSHFGDDHFSHYTEPFIFFGDAQDLERQVIKMHNKYKGTTP